MDETKFRSIAGGDGHIVIEWTDEALALIKKDGKRVVLTLPHDEHGGIRPLLSYIDCVDTQAPQPPAVGNGKGGE